jgi:hypothetical protein
VAGGGDNSGAFLAKNIGEVAAKNIPEFVREFLETYLNGKSRYGSFRKYLENEGESVLQGLCRKYEEMSDSVSDLGRDGRSNAHARSPLTDCSPDQEASGFSGSKGKN